MNKAKIASTLILLSLFFSSCVEERSGCLDPEASNFDASADESGDCIYPGLKVSISYCYDTIAYQDSLSIFRTGIGDSLRINNFGISVFNWGFKGVNNKDSIQNLQSVYIGDDMDSVEQVLNDDHMYWQSDRFNYELKSLTNSGVYDSVQFSIGVDERWKESRPYPMESDWALKQIYEDALWSEADGYIVLHLDLHYGADLENLVTILFGEDILKLIILEKVIIKERARDLNLNLKLDWKVILEDLDFASLSIEGIKEQILQNFEKAITCR